MSFAPAMLSGAGPHGIAVASYGLAALAYISTALLMLTRWRQRGSAIQFAIACVVNAIWALVIAVLAAQGMALAVQGDFPEIVRTFVWLALPVLLLAPSGGRRHALAAIAGLALLQAMLCIAAPLSQVLAQLQLCLVIVRLLAAIFGLILVEQVYRATPPQRRWAVKFACLGLATLFAFDFYLYSDSLLLHRINADLWAARGLVDALCAPLLAMTVSRNAPGQQRLALSRYVLLRSVALLGAALYLLLMAGGAYLIRYAGGAWGPVMQLASLCGALLLLAGVLFSGTWRARLKVWVSKHFYRSHYDYRQEWLGVTQAMSAAGPALGERCIQALARLVESPAGALWIRRDADIFEAVASLNWPATAAQERADGPFCQHLEQRQWIIDVPQSRASDQAEVPLPAWLDQLATLWLIIPLLLHGRLFGFVALAQPRVPLSLNWEVRDLLHITGSQAASYLAYQESAEALLQSRQFAAFNRMSTFVVHDLKNLVAQLSLLLRNAERHKANPAFQQDMLATLDHSVQKMTLLLHKLARGDAPEAPQPLSIDEVLARLVAQHGTAEPAPQLLLAADGLTVLAHATRLQRVLGHLLQNAIDATPRDGHVRVSLQREQQSAVIQIEDSGQGMSAQFIRERLFRPFDTTKPAGMGVGAYESREYIRDIGGEIDVVSVPAQGTTIRVVLPLHGAAAAA